MLTAHEARKLAIRRLAEVSQGSDPSEERLGAIKAPRMLDLFARYLEQHAKPRKKPSSVESDERMWKHHLKGRLGAIQVREVSRADVDALHYGLRAKPIIANRVLALLSKMFNLSERWGWRDDGTNPCRHVERYRERSRQRFLSEAELCRLG